MQENEKSAELSPAKKKLYELLQKRKQAEKKAAARTVGITPVDRSGPLPLSFSQQRIWFVDYLEPGNVAYNVPGALRIEGKVSVPALEESLNRVIERHEVIRTRILAEGGQPRQVILKKLRLPLPVVDLRALPEVKRQRLTGRLATEQNLLPYRLDQAPLLRIFLVRSSDREYVLLVNMHHSIADTWAITVFMNEMAALYEAFVERKPSRLPALGIQYADFAVWQRQQLAGEVLADQMAYWCRELGGELPVLELPTDRPRPSIQTIRGRRHYLSVSSEVTAGVKALGRREETTPFVITLAAFNLMLHRCTGQTDLLVGVPVAGRRRSELEALVGLFMNVLVFRTDLGGEPTARQLVGRLQARTVAALQHQDLPFERLVETLKLDRDLSRTPIYQVLFNMQVAATESRRCAGVDMSVVDVDSGTARFDVETILWEQDGCIRGYMEYNTDLFDPTTMVRMAESFRRILGDLVRDPDVPICGLARLSAVEAHQLLREWNDTRALPLAAETILPLLEATADASPEADAVIFEGETLSYRALREHSDQLARFLRARGAGPEAVVGICMERCFELVVGMVGILKAGGAYLPLDPTHPDERLRWMVEDAGVRVILTRGPLLGDWSELPIEIVRLDERWDEIARGPAAPAVRPGLSGAGAAYVIYTSGSTGTPKGVVCHHRGLVNRLLWGQEHFVLTPEDRVLQKTSFTFDVSLWEFFWPLITGAGLVLARPGGQRDPAYLAGLIAEQGVSTIHFVPSMLRVFLDAPEAAGCTTLKRAILSGEALPEELTRRFTELLPGISANNLYGPTEAAIEVTAWRYRPEDRRRPTVPIGRPIANLRTYLVDARLRPVPLGVPGELCLGGVALARGYLNRPELTAEVFVPDPFSAVPGERLYRTGDLVRHLAGGEVEFLHRLDHQIKVRGYRIELGEIEAHLASHPAIDEGVVVVETRAAGDRRPARLVGCVTAAGEPGPDLAGDLRAFLKERLPEYMVPALYMTLEDLPRTASGKVDRKALSRRVAAAADARPKAARVAPRSDTERRVAEIWQEVLGVEAPGVADNFFDLGGDSLLLAQVHSKLRETFETDMPMVALFRYTTIRSLAEHFHQGEREDADHREGARRADVRRRRRSETGSDIAIVGTTLYFPDSRTPRQFWRNLCDGVELVGFFTVEECLEAGADPEMLAHPDYVRAEAVVEDVELFDPFFFGLTPREAELIDPQQRVMLELGWETLERAGYCASQYDGSIGVFTGAAISSYLFNNLGFYRAVDIFTDFNTRVLMLTGNDKDFCAQRLSYQLKLGGPSVNIQSACSSALMALHVACQSLLAGECDMAFAGGVQIRVPLKIGYLYQEGGLPSPDGHCRAFDAKGMGTVHGNGASLVLLKRLEDALEDRDTIHAVIKGSAANNDAGTKVGFTAPSLEGITRVVSEALAISGVDPATIRFVEAHGTGTDLGDTLEVAALTRALRSYTDKRQFCYLGSVKSNMGHMDAAAGMPSLLKAVMALQEGKIPPTLHFEEPNPKLDLPATPFRVNAELVDWPEDGGEGPRRAAVNIFGIGGSNTCVVLEEAPRPLPCDEPIPWQLLTLSAKTTTALDALTRQLAEFLRADSGVELADAAFTLHVGREGFPMRRAVVCRETADAVAALESLDPERVIDDFYDGGSRTTSLLLPGELLDPEPWVGELWETEPGFRTFVEECAELARPELDADLAALLCGRGERVRWSAPSAVTQAGLFAVQYALARLWMEWGVVPHALVGLGVGELVAACLAGGLPLPLALSLAMTRGRILERLPAAAVLAVELAADEAQARAAEELTLTATISDTAVALCGAESAVEALAAELGEGTEHRRWPLGRVPSPADAAPLAAAFTSRLENLAPATLGVPIVSTLTGDWLAFEDLADPQYWVLQLAEPLAVDRALETLFEQCAGVLLEVGEGEIPVSWLEQHPSCSVGQVIVPALGREEEPESARSALLRALGRLWAAGIDVVWTAVHAHETRRRIILPTYPFERQRCWVESRAPLAEQRQEGFAPRVDRDVARWFYTPTWKRRSRIDQHPLTPAQEPCGWLVLGAEEELGRELARRLAQEGHAVVSVSAGDAPAELADGGRTLRPDRDEDYETLFGELRTAGKLPSKIVHCWGLAPPGSGEDGTEDRASQSLLSLGRSLARSMPAEAVTLDVLASGIREVVGDEELSPQRAVIRGICRVLGDELPALSCRLIDLPANGRGLLADALVRELGDAGKEEIAYRGRYRWVLEYECFSPPPASGPAEWLPREPVVVLTGGPAEAALGLAEDLVGAVGARLAFVESADFPAPEKWREVLSETPDESFLARKIRLLQKLEEQGTRVLVVRADPTDRVAMAEGIARIAAELGAIGGIVHSTGMAAREAAAGDVAVQRDVLRLESRSLEVLAEVLGDARPTFAVVLGDQEAILPGRNRLLPFSLNAWVQAFVQLRNRTASVPWRLVTMDAWKRASEQASEAADSSEPGGEIDPWNLVADGKDPLKQGSGDDGAMRFAMTPAEGVEVWRRLLVASDMDQIVVSTGDLELRLRGGEEEEGSARPSSLHARPAIQQEYVGPRDELERLVVQVWEDVLGIGDVGIFDEFFELGGNSLLATQLVSRLRALFQVELPLRELLELRTVAGIAAALKEREAEVTGEDDLDRLLEELEGMPEEEAAQIASIGT